MIVSATAAFFVTKCTGDNKVDDIKTEYDQRIDSILQICNQLPVTVIKTDTVFSEKVVKITEYVPQPIHVGDTTT